MRVERQLRHDLQQEGFTDIRIQPEGFLVQARDPHGNPVTMLLTPNSVTAVTAEGANGRGMNGNMSGEGMNNGYSQPDHSGQNQSGGSNYSQNGGGSEH